MAESKQGTVPTIYFTLMFPLSPAGLKVLPETPVPDQVPPVVAVAVNNVFKLSVVPDWQIEAGAVHAAFADETT